ncbi:hypothetical protein AVEN_134601-1 [Araneus ventricosus]|uniref:MATH domain-containing protein n=1 Tax=Araneus ventricosus TaxID=182803 RepID=A0A4Y2KSE1_ARAVE|nr:hypothetical protein AVEN_134601-1 [Araneus ventricosus]
MAEGNLNGVKTTEENLVDGHIVVYKFQVHRLDVTKRTFCPLEYNAQCPTTPTLWEIELKYEPVPEDNGSYAFSIMLKRKDSSDHRVKASLFVTFHDVHRNYAFSPIASNRGGMVLDDELQGASDNILPEKLGEVVAVRVTIVIENCHQGTGWHCASSLNNEFLRSSDIHLLD